MASSQPAVADPVIAFSSFQQRRIQNKSECFTARDKFDLNLWREAARLAGFDRLVVHDREEEDASEVGDFLSVHRSGESWSRWGFARKGAKIRAWCSMTYADRGEYATLPQAFEAVLGLAGPASAAEGLSPLSGAGHRGAVVTDLMPFLRARAPDRLGSAA